MAPGEAKGFRVSQEKLRGSEPYSGLGYDCHPDWMLTERQNEAKEPIPR
jgi:hypothetical protein